jgi:hypothetical protein
MQCVASSSPSAPACYLHAAALATCQSALPIKLVAAASAPACLPSPSHDHGQLHDANPLTSSGIAHISLWPISPAVTSPDQLTKLTSALQRVSCCSTCSTLGPRLTLQPSSGNGPTAYMKISGRSTQRQPAACKHTHTVTAAASHEPHPTCSQAAPPACAPALHLHVCMLYNPQDNSSPSLCATQSSTPIPVQLSPLCCVLPLPLPLSHPSSRHSHAADPPKLRQRHVVPVPGSDIHRGVARGIPLPHSPARASL